MQGETERIMCSSSLPLDKALSQTHTILFPDEFSHILPRFRRREVERLHYVQRSEEDSEKSGCSVQATQVTATAIKMLGVCLQWWW